MRARTKGDGYLFEGVVTGALEVEQAGLVDLDGAS